MTKKIVSNLSVEQGRLIESHILKVNRALECFNGDELLFELSDITRLQIVIDNCDLIEVTYQSLSLAFTEVFIAANPEYKWVSVRTDEDRLAIQFLHANIWFYPESTFEKAMKKNKSVRAIYLDVLAEMRALVIKEGFYANE